MPLNEPIVSVSVMDVVTRLELVPIPDRLNPPWGSGIVMRCRDDRGIPIPGIIAIPPEANDVTLWKYRDSFVDYDILDHNKWAWCVNNDWCCYCGFPNDYYKFFVGHQDEVKTSLFMNPGMHAECAMYFAQIYPYVYLPRMRSAAIEEGGKLPSLLGIVKVKNYKVMEKKKILLTRDERPTYVIRVGNTSPIAIWCKYQYEDLEGNENGFQCGEISGLTFNG